MRTEPHIFYSDGLKLSASFFLPDEPGGGEPGEPGLLVVPCSGFTGLCAIHPARFARFLTARGIPCFGFDYRGFGASEGPKRRVVLDEQVRDIVHAVAFAEADPRVDRDRIVLLGWGMGAGLALEAARELLGVAGIICVNGFYDGKRVQRAHRGDKGYWRFRAAARKELSERARNGLSATGDPFHFYPLDPQSRAYVETVLCKTEAYDVDKYSFELADSLLRWHPEAHAPHMRTPLLIAHGEQNRLHPPEEAKALHAAYGGPKELFWIPDAGHTEWMHDDDARFVALGERIVEWLGRLEEAQSWR